ncbi:MAG: DUF3253 domain-containing protein [Hyphomonadaceae bacterium]|nr:DUF3253 domain-containing protein [Hyphomonadaceae bacterium]
MTAEDAILTLTAQRGPASSICPSEAARALDAENWRQRMGEVRAVAVRLAKAGRIQILRKGKPVDPDAFKGVIRLRIVDDPDSNPEA